MDCLLGGLRRLGKYFFKMEQELLGILKTNKQGLSVTILLSKLNTTNTELTKLLNELTERMEIELLHSNNQIIVRTRTQQEIDILKVLNHDELIIYKLIQQSQTKGIWLKLLRDKSQLHTKIVNDSIKRMEKLKIVKQVKSVKTNKKVYMLYEMEPNIELTGGSWYTDEEMDMEFINELCSSILKFITSKSSPVDILMVDRDGISDDQVHSWLMNSNITTQQLSLEDVQLLLNRLCFDDLLFYTGVGYRVVKNQLKASNGFVESGCGQCPVFQDCSSEGVVNPNDCVYLTDWLV